jgi:precorrin-6B methylase 2
VTFGLSFCLILFALAAAGAARGQASRELPPMARTDFIPVTGGDGQQRMMQEMAKRANLERQVQMKSDTEKLFKLAEELKDSVGKSNSNILSIEVMKKANAIEKLAHSVKDKMRGPN